MGIKFTLRPEYEGLVGGTTAYGSGQILDVVAELEAGDGSIVTDDPQIIDALRQYRGAQGPVLQEEGASEEDVTVTSDPVEATAPGWQGAPPTASEPPTPASEEAVHESSGYAGLSTAELKDELQQRGLPVTGSKSELVAALEANDAKEQQ